MWAQGNLACRSWTTFIWKVVQCTGGRARSAQPAQIPRARRNRLALRCRNVCRHDRYPSRSHQSLDPDQPLHVRARRRQGDRSAQIRAGGVRLYGSVAGASGTMMAFLPDLEKNLDDADRSYMVIRKQIDAWIAAHAINAPEEPPFEKVWRPVQEITEVDLAEAGITSIIWAIGFRPDYSWLKVDCTDQRGKPVFRRGVTDARSVFYWSWLAEHMGLRPISWHRRGQPVSRRTNSSTSKNRLAA